MAHVKTIIALAPTPAEKTALSQVATAPRGIDKQAILDVYPAGNLNADLSRFTPQLMKGTA